MKTTLLLATALFLVSAPSPDSKTLSEFSAGFLATTDNQGLMASTESVSDQPAMPVSLTRQTSRSAERVIAPATADTP